ncbi:hypothetical protein SteCoe_3212 [Stentor coeruleus]|uniref:EF-hand domain-containing protein n=1 Tax=Stentor coeruleus TaxID=5963 RepID=A0A1R2CXN2_9CILI|nr:hypothetical protein SteCoe_3212 [Stentor coeruleus]
METRESRSSISETNWFSDLNSPNWLEFVLKDHSDLGCSFRTAIEVFALTLRDKVVQSLPSNSTMSIYSKVISNLYPEIACSVSQLPVETILRESLTERSDYSLDLDSNSDFFRGVDYMPGSIEDSIEKIDDPEDSGIMDPDVKILVSDADENLDIVECTLFRRVLNIFNHDNRSVADLYASLDKNRDGKVTAGELRAELLKYDPTITEEESNEVFDIFDGDKDGTVSMEELGKRMKFIKQKAEQEVVDPLACMIISKPLRKSMIHGSLSIVLLKAQGLKPGAHSFKSRIKGLLEYATGEYTDCNPILNFHCDFHIENKNKEELPGLIEIELITKNKVEGSANFSWVKAMATPYEYSCKGKVDLKTSTGQLRGILYLQAQWNPIRPKSYTEKELNKLVKLGEEVEKRKKEVKELEKRRKTIQHTLTDEFLKEQENKEEQEHADGPHTRSDRPKAMTYFMNICKITVEKNPDVKTVGILSPTVVSPKSKTPCRGMSPKNSPLASPNCLNSSGVFFTSKTPHLDDSLSSAFLPKGTSPPHNKTQTSPHHNPVSPPQNKETSPPQHKVASPPQHKEISPPQHKEISPSQHKEISPSQHKVASPPQNKEISPPQHKGTSQPQHLGGHHGPSSSLHQKAEPKPSLHHTDSTHLSNQTTTHHPTGSLHHHGTTKPIVNHDTHGLNYSMTVNLSHATDKTQGLNHSLTIDKQHHISPPHKPNQHPEVHKLQHSSTLHVGSSGHSSINSLHPHVEPKHLPSNSISGHAVHHSSTTNKLEEKKNFLTIETPSLDAKRPKTPNTVISPKSNLLHVEAKNRPPAKSPAKNAAPNLSSSFRAN